MMRGPRLTVDIVLIHADRVLLIQRGRDPYKGKWALPGGFVEDGETTEQAARREAKEETGLDIVPHRLIGVYSDPARDPRGHVVSVAYHAAPAPGSHPEHTRGGDDAAVARWHPVDRPPPLAFDHAKILHDATSHGIALS